MINCASAYLEKLAPKHVKAFRETFAQGKGPEHGLSALVGIRVDHRFKVWRNICINLIDVELQMHRVKNCLILVNSPAVSPLNQGEWVEYHFDAWAVLMQGLLHRIEKLTKGIVRELIRPTNANWKLVETQTLEKVKDFQKRVKKIRDPIAHTGGAVEALADGHLLESYILIGGHTSTRDLLQPMASYQKKWHKNLSIFSTLVFDEMDRIGERLCKEMQ